MSAGLAFLINATTTHSAPLCNRLSWNISEVYVTELSCFFLDRLKTPKRAVFAGSMQLLAGIKLCTGRILTNHPHYEDQALRERTRQVRVSGWFGLNHNSIQIWICLGPPDLLGQKLTCGNFFVKVTYGIVTYQVWWPIHRISALLLTHPKWTHTHTHTHTP